jgi:MIP family channel proteins
MNVNGISCGAVEAATTTAPPQPIADARPTLARRAGAEGIAAFALVFAGCGAAVSNAVYDGALGQVGVALTFGLAVMAMDYATGHLSGAHINPAVTLAFTLTRHFPAREAGAYVAAQAVGATLAALALLAVWPDQPAQLGATVPATGVAVGSALVYELILTAILMFTIMAVATDTRAVGAGAAIAIGGAVGLDALFGGPVTGASMNPARTLGPAIAAGEWRDFWIYVVGPVAGATLAALAYQSVRGEQH